MNDKKNIIIAVLLIIIFVLLSVMAIKTYFSRYPQTRGYGNIYVDDCCNNLLDATPQSPFSSTPAPSNAVGNGVAPSPEPAPAFNAVFADNNWLLDKVTVDGKAVNMDAKIAQALTLNFNKAKGTYSGFAGCNSFSGSYTGSAPDKFSFGATAATMMYCEQAGAMEAQILKAMGKVVTFTISKTPTLILQSADGKTVLQYKLAI